MSGRIGPGGTQKLIACPDSESKGEGLLFSRTLPRMRSPSYLKKLATVLGSFGFPGFTRSAFVRNLRVLASLRTTSSGTLTHFAVKSHWTFLDGSLERSIRWSQGDHWGRVTGSRAICPADSICRSARVILRYLLAVPPPREKPQVPLNSEMIFSRTRIDSCPSAYRFFNASRLNL